jgi:uncharacterized protein
MKEKRNCGTCSLCCKLPYVRELNKPIDTWCKHACPGKGGCSIYPQRPHTCQKFMCGWLEGVVGDEWFPGRAKMFLSAKPKDGLTGVLVTVDPNYSNAWRREPFYSQLLNWAQSRPVAMRIGHRFITLRPNGTEDETTRTQAWIEGRDEPDAASVSS